MSTEGIFYLESVELRTCLFEYAIAHIRGGEGYVRSWYDAEAATEAKKTYKTTVSSSGQTGEIYIMVDSYPVGTIPIHDDCIKKASTDAADLNVVLTVE